MRYSHFLGSSTESITLVVVVVVMEVAVAVVVVVEVLLAVLVVTVMEVAFYKPVPSHSENSFWNCFLPLDLSFHIKW